MKYFADIVRVQFIAMPWGWKGRNSSSAYNRVSCRVKLSNENEVKDSTE